MKTRISLRLHQVLGMSAMILLAGCQQDMMEPEINQNIDREVPVVLTARQGGAADTRTTYTLSTPENDGSIAMGVKWDGGEDEMLAYTYYNKEGAGVHFNCLFPVENSITDDGKSQDFEGTIIKNDEENGLLHYFLYPCPGDSRITKDVAEQTLTVRYPMNNQVQDCTTGNETKHLADYDIMRAMDFQVESGNTTIEFEHLTSLFYMDFTLPENKAISTIKLISDKAIFGTEYRMTFRVLNTGCASGTDDDKMATTMELTLQNDAADNSVKGYLMLAPYGMPDPYTVNISAEAIAVDGTVYQSEATTINIASGYLFEPGTCKTMKRILEKVVLPMGDKTAAQAIKGDFAMADGTFISKDATLSDEQIANVRGVVFWTENEDGNATLASDLVMAGDYSNCTHGLIVSVKNIANVPWQNTADKVSTFQNDNPTYASNGSSYKSIVSGGGSTEPVNYILGYQNTQILKAYNEQCADANKVLPLSKLEEWVKEGNEAPENTTGWYIPSAKELHMLSYKDVDNVGDYNNIGTDTMTEINQSIAIVNGDQLDSICWSSTEGNYAGYDYIFVMLFNYGYLSYEMKEYSSNVRAVCAF
ncbi:MAG: hypothetical protein E7099_09710 [Mediterranea massiliensis]|nr:hypothetical protein [Mediterranea massiliensis]